MYAGLNGLKPRNPQQDSFLKHIPTELSTALKRLDIHPDLIYYASCPKCFAIYPPTSDQSGKLSYPTICTHHETPASPQCNEPLLRTQRDQGGSGGAPRACYAFQPFESWLGRLLSRDGLEDVMEQSWKQVPRRGRFWDDIWQTPFLKSLQGPDNKPLSQVAPGEARLMFSLFVDWLNPNGNKASGKNNSVGVIYMACLNLPKHLRFLPENIYLAGVIPGPKGPSLSQVNHFLRPLVDSLMTFWNPGTFFSRTAKYTCGRLVRCVMIPLVCDLQAVRKVAGFSAPKSTWFCSFCRQKWDDKANFELETWPRVSADVHKTLAGVWRDAPDKAQQKALFDINEFRLFFSAM